MKFLLVRMVFAILLVGQTPGQQHGPLPVQQGPLPQPPGHGVMLSWIAAGPPSVVAQGFEVFRCFGTCAASSTNWTLISGATALPAATTSYLDAATAANAPNLATTYSYVVVPLDANGNPGLSSNVITVTTPASWPTTALGAPTLNPATIT